jgi:putative transposase
MRPKGSPKELEKRRFRAVTLLEEGYQPVEVARVLRVDRRSVRRWNASRRTKGVSSLKAKPAPGRPSRLGHRQKHELRQMLMKGASRSGFPTDLWTCPRVAQVIRNRFKVDYHVDHLSRLLHSLGFSPQKPQHQAIERDEKAIHQWILTEWPSIKKKYGR